MEMPDINNDSCEQRDMVRVKDDAVKQLRTRSSNIQPMKKVRIIKNLLVLAFSHFLVFTAFDSLSNLQSTVNNEGGLGVASQATIYAFFVVSSLILPTFLIEKFGCNITLIVSIFGLALYVAANFYPQWSTLMPAAAISGISFGPLWAARSTYVNELSHGYARHVHGSIDVINAWFFGIYSFFHENSEIWGNVISYVVLKSSNENDRGRFNETSLQCGASFCEFGSFDWNSNLEPPPTEKRFLLVSIYVCLMLIAGLIIALMLDTLPKSVCEHKHSKKYLFLSTMRQLKNKDQLLLLPISFYCGLVDGFYNSDFTRSFIACAWGISQVGFVTIFYGIACAFMDVTAGCSVKTFGRVPVFSFAAASHISMLIVCLLWTPTPNEPYVYYLLSGLFGLGSSVWWTQIPALHGALFKDDEEAAFSNFYLWSAMGSLLAYSYSDYVCTDTKIYTLSGLLIFSLLGYLIVERRQRYSPVSEVEL